tara:strand:+ start:2541 stop:3524 length:984 start_codon:yes stop_codon:yes gene_type:complete
MLHLDLDLDLAMPPPPPPPTPVGSVRHRPRKRRKVNDPRKRNQAMQHRLQVLMVAQWNKPRVSPHPEIVRWLESDWFFRVCQFVGPVGAHALCLLARTSKAVTQAMWMANVRSMRRLGMGHGPEPGFAAVPTGLPFLPWYSVDGCKRKYVPRYQEAHPVPNVFRIGAPSRLCRVCYGAQSASTQIKVKVGPHFASGGREVVPVCEPCVGVLSAPAWTSVQVFCWTAPYALFVRNFDNGASSPDLERIVNPENPKRRTTCGWPTVLLGPLCRAAGLSDALYAQLASHMARALSQARARREEAEVVRRALLDCAVRWGGVSAEVRRGLR